MPRTIRIPLTSPRILSLLRLVRTQIDELNRFLAPLPAPDPLDAESVVRVNTALRLTRTLVTREKAAAFIVLLPERQPVTIGTARLAVVQAHGAVLAFVQRYGRYDPQVEKWMLPGERSFIVGYPDEPEDDLSDYY